MKWILFLLGPGPEYLKFIFLSPVWLSCIFMYLLSRCINIHYGCPKIDIHLGRYIINVYLRDLARRSSAVIFVSIDILVQSTGSQLPELYIEVWDVCHAGGGRLARGARVASLARRNAWLEFQMDLSLSLSLSHSVVIVKRWVVPTLKMTNLTWSTRGNVANNYFTGQVTLICWQSSLSRFNCLYLPVLSNLKAM